ncbi:MAG: hypothetical protein WA172_05610 [Terriglobales bacterium]
MNPLACSASARRVMALAAISGLFLLAGCGSTNLPKANNSGFSASNLSGTYVFSSEGSDSSTGDLIAMAGAFTANASGGITAGTMDIIDPSVGVASAQTITAGSYTVNTDGRGQVNLTSAAGTFALGFVLTSTSNGVSFHGSISEFDTRGSGSGTLDLQSGVTSLSQLAGPYAFNISGVTGSNISAATGAFTLSSGGTITAGIEDLNAAPFVYPAETITGGATLGSGTAPGSITLTTSNFSLTFDFYPIDATHVKLIETDDTNFLIGDAFSQTGASIPNGPMVFTMAGGTNSTGPIALGGLMTSNGTGNFPSGLEDVNDSGSVNSSQLQFSGTAAGPASTGGRVEVNLSGFTPATNWVIYPSSGGLLMLEIDSSNLTQGVGYAQAGTSFSAGTSIGYGMNLTGENPNSEIDDIAQFDATTATTNNVTGVLQENDEGSLTQPLNLTGTYTPDSPVTGRGSIVVPSLGTPLGGLTLEYYVVDSSTVLTIEVDADQVAAGLFQLQSSSIAGAPQGAAAAHRSMFMVRPLARSHAAKQLKK